MIRYPIDSEIGYCSTIVTKDSNTIDDDNKTIRDYWPCHYDSSRIGEKISVPTEHILSLNANNQSTIERKRGSKSFFFSSAIVFLFVCTQRAKMGER